MPFGKNLQKIVDKLILCVNICHGKIKKQKDLYMSYCANCSNKDRHTGKCAYSGDCIIKQLDLDPEYIPDFIASVKEAVEAEVKAKKANEVLFNPFQRGNGCVLPGVSAKDFVVRTR